MVQRGRGKGKNAPRKKGKVNTKVKTAAGLPYSKFPSKVPSAGDVLGVPTPPPPSPPVPIISAAPPPIPPVTPQFGLSPPFAHTKPVPQLKLKRKKSNNPTATTKPWLDNPLKNQVWKSLVLHKELMVANKELHPTKAAESGVQEIMTSLKKMVGTVFESREVIKLTMLDKQGLALNGTTVTGIKVGSGWDTPGVKVGMRILAVNGIPVQCEEEIRDKLLRSSSRFQLTIEGGDSFERKVHIIGSWSHDTALNTSPIDICVDTPFDSDWISRLAAVLRNSPQFEVTSVCDRVGDQSVNEPHIVATSSLFPLGNIHLFLSPELARNNNTFVIPPMGKPLLRIMKKLAQTWRCPISPHVIAITVVAYIRSMHHITLGWMNGCDTLSSLFLGYLYWYGLVIDWNTTRINSIIIDGQCFSKKEPDSNRHFVILDPSLDVNVLDHHSDQVAFAQYLKFVSRTYAVLSQGKRGLDHVLPRANLENPLQG
eukprot:TRINITY_DN12074_c0_g1_i1.p1 TRINITY_DN12074_c0_g1~~TRINITY_DN12074_c0_g1_i1.p1  ORF type:complete len:495 (+),score=66.40 TRINITY_DN12074_c0_g1_i1:37-1485(+)